MNNQQELQHHLRCILSDGNNRHAYNRLLQQMRLRMQIFYRLDIQEDKFNMLMQRKVGDELTSGLANLVLEREMQKAKTRIAYREHLKKTQNDGH